MEQNYNHIFRDGRHKEKTSDFMGKLYGSVLSLRIGDIAAILVTIDSNGHPQIDELTTDIFKASTTTSADQNEVIKMGKAIGNFIKRFTR